MSLLNQKVAERSFDHIEKNKVNVLDMCTGSGCIAVSIAHYCPDCRVVACDISADALDIAKINSEQNGTVDRLEFYLGDLFSALDGCPEDKRKFDIIASNPPYIETGIISGLQTEVKENEPMTALDGGKDGLVFYRRIIEAAPKYLNKGGWLAFEIGYDQGMSLQELMQPYFGDISVLKDIGGNDRVVIGRAKGEM
jgi:release factor glutamine methyltransferase